MEWVKSGVVGKGCNERGREERVRVSEWVSERCMEEVGNGLKSKRDNWFTFKSRDE